MGVRDRVVMIGGTLRIGDLHPRSSFRSTSSTARTNAVRLKGTTTISRGTAGVAWNWLGIIRDDASLRAQISSPSGARCLGRAGVVIRRHADRR